MNQKRSCSGIDPGSLNHTSPPSVLAVYSVTSRNAVEVIKKEHGKYKIR